jgi:photosystem II stability/assembly factor-like uncharacterized protein
MTFSRRDFALSAAALGLQACATPAKAVVAAATWQRLPTVAYKGKQDDVSFIDAKTGWYGNGEGKFYATQDGGETWTKVADKPGTFVRALGFIDAQTGFIGNVGMDYYPGVSDSNPLYRTRDGGVTWSAVTAPDIDIVKGICGIDMIPHMKIFQGELRSTIAIHAAGRVGGPATMLRSLDSGETWRVVDLRKQAGMILDVKFFDVETGLVCAATSADIAEAEALILRTSDGGQTWSEVYRGTRPFENCWKMSFPTASIGYATVQNYEEGKSERVFLKTTDGGRSWREMPLVNDAAVRQFGVGFVDAKTGWIGTSTTGFGTTDGGASWAPVEMGAAVNKIRVLKAGSETRVFAIGKELHRLDIVPSGRIATVRLRH